MTRSRVASFAAIGYGVLLCGGVGFGAYRLFLILPREWHAALIGASAALMTVVSATALQVFGKYDRLLQDSEKYDLHRMRSVYQFVHGSRRRLTILLFLTAMAGVVNAGIAVLLSKPQALNASTVRILVAVGYGGLALILLFAVRVAHVYLRFDEFRRAIVETIMRDEAREKALLELRPSTLTPFPPAKSSTPGSPLRSGLAP